MLRLSCAVVLLFLLSFSAPGAERPWIDLLKDQNFEAFRPNKAKEGDYVWAESVELDAKNPKLLSFKAGKSPILVNGAKGRAPDLYTKLEHGDLEVEVEFLIAKGSNSGIKFHGVSIHSAKTN